MAFPRLSIRRVILLGGVMATVTYCSPTPSSDVTIAVPATGATCRTQWGSQDVYAGSFDGTAPASGAPTPQRRVDDLGLGVWRVQAVDDAGASANSIPFPSPYTSTNGNSVSAWDFSILDRVLSNGPVGVPRLLDITRPPDVLWTNSGPLYGGSPTAGTIADQSYQQLASYMVGVEQYFRAPMLASDAGPSVTYGPNRMTDTNRNLATFGAGYFAVTATIPDANGFRRWETATITGVSADGHTVTLAWPNGAPPIGAAYNLAWIFPPVSSPSFATPWPRPPSVGDVRYFELFNESDLSNWSFPRTSPSLPPPTPVLTPVNVPGGTLVPGATYAYRLTSMSVGATESTPGPEVAVWLPAGANAIQVAWAPTTNLGLSPFAYRLYGRRPGSEQAMVVVGRDAPGGFTWTDDGKVGPSGGLPATDDTAGFQVWRANEYTRMWNVVAPAMKAADPTVKLVGPTISNPISLANVDVNTHVVTSDPGDTSYRNTADYIPTLMAGASPRPDVISFHGYGGFRGSQDTDAGYFQGVDQAISDFQGTDATAVGSTPAWLSETNLEAGWLDATDYREMTQLGSAWIGHSFAAWCSRAPQLSELFQFEAQQGNTWTLIAGQDAPGTCYPQPSCLNVKAGEPNLEYWALQWINRLFPPGSRVAQVTGVPAGVDVLAVQQPGSASLSVLVVNRRTGASPGLGAPAALTLHPAGMTPTDAKVLVIDGDTDLAQGPVVADLGSQGAVSLSLPGYAVAIVTFSAGA